MEWQKTIYIGGEGGEAVYATTSPHRVIRAVDAALVEVETDDGPMLAYIEGAWRLSSLYDSSAFELYATLHRAGWVVWVQSLEVLMQHEVACVDYCAWEPKP